MIRGASITTGARSTLDALNEYGHAFEGGPSVDVRKEAVATRKGTIATTPAGRLPIGSGEAIRKFAPFAMVLVVAHLLAGS